MGMGAVEISSRSPALVKDNAGLINALSMLIMNRIQEVIQDSSNKNSGWVIDPM